ncbi:hypothetical protein ABFT80_00750 [Mesorhizobium sp. SB112]|uniref:hypothetical protein n=1 Tax=Mesorhizobium sp. SB112 TaxID=3151853 RepID=UPI003262CEE3
MPKLNKIQLAFLAGLGDRQYYLPVYHAPSAKLERNGYIRRSQPDSAGDCAVTITAKGRKAISPV